MRLSIDSPNIYENELPPDLNRWFSKLVGDLNYIFGNMVAQRTANVGGGGVGPIKVLVTGMDANSVVVGNIQSSTNTVSIAKMTSFKTTFPNESGFNITFSSDPGASCFINYVVFLSPVEAQGV